MKCKRNKKFYTQNVCHKNGVLVPFKGAIMYHLHGDEKLRWVRAPNLENRIVKKYCAKKIMMKFYLVPDLRSGAPW